MANPFRRAASELAQRLAQGVAAPPAGQAESRWLPSITNPDARGLALFYVRGDLVYPTQDNARYGGYVVDPVFELRGPLAWPTMQNRVVAFGRPYFELRDGQVFPTTDNLDSPYGVALYDIG